MFQMTKREKQMIRYFFNYVLKFKKHFLLMTIIMILSTVLTLYLPLANKALLDKGLLKMDFQIIIIYLAIVFAVKLADDGLNSLQNLQATFVKNKFTYNLSKDVFKKIIRFPLGFFEKFNLGELTARINIDIGKLAILVDNQLISMIKDGCILLGIIFLMIKLNLQMFLLSLLTVPIIVLLNQYIASQQKVTTRTIRKQYDLKTERLQEVILGIRDIKAFNVLKWAEKRFLKAQGQIFRQELKINKLVAIIFFLSNRFHSLIQTGVYLYGAYFLVKGHLSLGELFAFLAYFDRSIFILERLVNFNRTFQSALVSMDRVYELISENMNGQPLSKKYASQFRFPERSDKIAFQDVTFAYQKSNPILKEISLQIGSGEKVVLIGDNGSGKSTILKLLAGLIQPAKGKIYLDGVDLAQLTKGQITKKIAYVTQQPFIFHGSLKENLQIGNKHATDEELSEIIQRVGLNRLVDELPQGLDSMLTLSGTNLSGGQLQRLVIARALLKKTEVLLLDEPISNIEEIFAENLIINLVNDYPEQTLIMTVHKDSLLQYFDRVLCVKPSGIYEIGSRFTTKHSGSIN